MKNLDPELLHTLVVFAETGSLTRTATIVNRSPSAVTAQMQRLEDLVSERLLQPAGRGRTLTSAGEELVGHARRILDVQREAWLSLAGARADGRLAIGVTQDFVESALPGLLRQFGRSHPRVRMELRVGRTSELSRAFDEGGLDILLAMRSGARVEEVGLLREPMIWIGAEGAVPWREVEVPLALLDSPCNFRSTALRALEVVGRPHRLAATSGSLSGLRAAVSGGLAVTVRTSRWLGSGIADVGSEFGLPELPLAEFSLALRQDAPVQATDLAGLLASELAVERTNGGLGARFSAPSRRG